MLVEFSVENFLSFKELQTFQMEASKIRSRDPEVDLRNVSRQIEKLPLLKSKILFGANNSGKSNLLKALGTMKALVTETDGHNWKELLQTHIHPFALDEKTLSDPSFFQIVFIVGRPGMQFRYGFEATKDEIISEWLFAKPLEADKRVREHPLFTREGSSVSVNEKAAKKYSISFNPKSRSDFTEFPLVLNYWIEQSTHWEMKKIQDFWKENFFILQGDYLDWGWMETLKALRPRKIEFIRENILQVEENWISFISLEKPLLSLFQTIDPTISGFRLTNQGNDVVIFRKFFANQDKETPFLLSTQEGAGIKKTFALSYMLIQSLNKGGLLALDGLDAYIHPKLTQKIVEIFHLQDTNPRNAQLVAISYDTHLMDSNFLRKDQIAFVHKNRDGASSVYALDEFKGVRNDASFEKDYLLGKYYGVPSNLYALEDALMPDPPSYGSLYPVNL